MNKFETASSNDLNILMNCVGRSLVRNFINGLISPSQTPSRDFKSLVREGSRFGLIDDPEEWFEYRRTRNITSHTYDEATAEKVSAWQNLFSRMQNHCLKHWKSDNRSAFGTSTRGHD